MNLPEFAVRRPVLISMLFLGLMILGAVSFTRLQIDLLPEIDFPSISVVTVYDGAGPEEVENLITRPIEQAVSTVEGIESIESFSAEGRSRVALRFVWGTPLDTALNDVRATVERVKARMPEDAEEPVVYKFNIGSFPVMYTGLGGSMDEPALRRLAEQELVPRLERVEGVAAADVRGGLRREIQILLDAERLRMLEIAPAQIVAALREQNQNIPAGQIESFDNNVLVRTIGEANEPQDLLDVVVAIRQDSEGGKRPVLLSDVARVVDSFEEPTNTVRINGKPGIRLSITKQSGSNTVEVCDRIEAEIERINRDYRGKAQLTVLTDTSVYIERAISNVRSSVLLGALLAILVLLFFLRRLRPTTIIAIGIPIAIIGIFTLMYFFEITLNLISFGGIALGIGMLVDNAIVILESIFQKLEEGLDPFPAAIQGSVEVSGAIIASTITTLVVFVPVIFLSGFASIFFGQMAFVVSFALLCSLAVALTLIPTLSARFLRRIEDPDADLIGRGLRGLERLYSAIVRRCLDHKFITMFIALALLGGSFGLVGFVGTELLPTSDESEVRINLDMPVGTKLEKTEEIARAIEARIPGAVPEMVSLQTVVGTPGFWSTSGEEGARLEINLVKPDRRSRSSSDVANALRPVLEGVAPGGSVRVRAGGGLWILRSLRGGGERLEVQVRGYDLDKADRLAAEVERRMVEIDGITSARSDRQPGGRELHLRLRRERLAKLGMTPAQASNQLQTYVQGTRATVLRSGGDEYDVVVRMRPEDRADITALLDLPIILPIGGSTRLREIASVDDRSSPKAISRENQRRVVVVRAVLDEERRDLGSIASELRASLATIETPDNFSLLVKGEKEEQDRNFKSLLLGILLAVLLVYMVMAAQFESFIHPLVIMIAIPFAAIGVIAILVATGTTFNLQSFMGCIVLAGIVVNNAIVLVDYINYLRREEGIALRQAVEQSAQRRLRPILMTTMTTILALFPVALGMGEGGETQAPLARVVIGGLLVSGAISLVVVPVLYEGVERLRERLSQDVGKKDT